MSELSDRYMTAVGLYRMRVPEGEDGYIYFYKPALFRVHLFAGERRFWRLAQVLTDAGSKSHAAAYNLAGEWAQKLGLEFSVEIRDGVEIRD